MRAAFAGCYRREPFELPIEICESAVADTVRDVSDGLLGACQSRARVSNASQGETMALEEINVSDQIVAFKRKMAPRRDALKRAFADVKDYVSRAADTIRTETAAGRPACPRSTTATSGTARSQEAARQAIRRTGCAVVRGVFPATLAQRLVRGARRVSRDNHYEEREVEKRSLDKYFSALKAGKPQIFNVYWSKPQVMARQDPKLAETRAFLDRLWKYEGVFDPDRQCTYADRARRRQPGDKTLGLSPHMDAGTVERWIDPGYQQVYEKVFAGDWRGYDPFDAHASAGDARDPLARRLQHVPHLSGLDGADPARPERWDAAADPDRRRHLLRAPARVAGRRRRRRISAARRPAAPSASAPNGTRT